jgi:peptidoglycan/LPS O-acetylase OafA/YrhL
VFVTHIFRMSLFFFIAGLFSRMMWMRKGPLAFWVDRSLRILMPLALCWMLMSSLIPKIWVWGATVYFNGHLPTFPTPPGGLPAAPFGSVHWYHLWFLYVLFLLYVLVMGVRAIITAVDKRDVLGTCCENALAWMIQSGTGVMILGLPLCGVLMNNHAWVSWFGIPTPDNSIFTNPSALTAYFTAFCAGWVLQRRMDLLDLLARRWILHSVLAIVSTAVCLYVGGLAPSFRPAAQDTATMIYAFSYAVAIWSWIFGITGVAMRFLNQKNKVLRYLADSSYWFYLMHLPLVGALQVLLGPLPLHWSIKFPLLLLFTLSILLVSYHFLVRNTVIGKILNGKLYGKQKEEASSAATGLVNSTG